MINIRINVIHDRYESSLSSLMSNLKRNGADCGCFDSMYDLMVQQGEFFLKPKTDISFYLPTLCAQIYEYRKIYLHDKFVPKVMRILFPLMKKMPNDIRDFMKEHGLTTLFELFIITYLQTDEVDIVVDEDKCQAFLDDFNAVLELY